MPRPRVHLTNAERQSAYRARQRVVAAERSVAQQDRQRLLSAALAELDAAVAYGVAAGDGDCLTLARHDRAGQVSLLATWLREGADRDADGREAEQRGQR